MTSLLHRSVEGPVHRSVEGPVADDRMSSFAPTCCCSRGTCRVGCCGGSGSVGGGARTRSAAGRVARRSDAAPPLAPFPLLGISSLWTAFFCWGGGWCCCGAVPHATRSVADCNRRPPLSTSSSTSGDDDPFIVLTETKFSILYIPVWARYSPLRTRVEAHAITLSP